MPTDGPFLAGVTEDGPLGSPGATNGGQPCRPVTMVMPGPRGAATDSSATLGPVVDQGHSREEAPMLASGIRVGEELGRVSAVWRYPVKSMAPEPLSQTDVSWHGLAGDRRWAYVRASSTSTGFPWLTIRDAPQMLQFRPRLDPDAKPDVSPVIVETPDGRQLAVDDPRVVAELGGDVHALKLDRGAFDTLPISIISTQSIESLEALAGRELDTRRFRPNFVVDAFGDAEFPEDAWTGCTIAVGDALIRIDGRDQRCTVVNVDPVTAERDPIALRTIVRERDTRLGVYATTVRPGRVALGDSVVMAAQPHAA